MNLRKDHYRVCGPIWSGKPKPLRQPRARAGGGGRGAPARPSTPSAKSKVVTGERRIVLGKGIGTDTYLRCSPSSRGRGAPPPTGTLLARRPAGTVGSKSPRNRGRPSGVRPVFFFPKKNPEPWGLPPGTGAGPRRQGTGPHPFFHTLRVCIGPLPQNKKSTTLSGGSLGSCVDEERS